MYTDDISATNCHKQVQQTSVTGVLGLMMRIMMRIMMRRIPWFPRDGSSELEIACAKPMKFVLKNEEFRI